jgi:S1-C subfamily serine protease
LETIVDKEIFGWKIIAVTVICIALLAGSFVYAYFDLNSNYHRLMNELENNKAMLEALERLVKELSRANTSEGLEAEQIYNMTKDSVVLISNRQFVGGTLRTVGTGSGFVYRVRENIAYVVTNNHVIENAVEVRVTFLDGTTFTTHLKWGDVYTDLAVIEIFNIPETMNLKPLLIGNSTELKVGETVYAIGNPFGLEGSMTQGIVSQLGRSLPTATGYSIVDVIQFDAAVNPGNSGGPLLNSLGMVVGVTTAIETETGGFMGIGYAVSSELLERVVPSLIENGYYKHPWVGIEGVDMNIDIAREMETDYTYGFLVIRVIENSPAEEAGLQGGTRSVWIEGQEIIIGGDIIIGVDNRTVRKADDILTYLERYKSPGDKIVLTIVRNNEVITIDLTLGVRK